MAGERIKTVAAGIALSHYASGSLTNLKIPQCLRILGGGFDRVALKQWLWNSDFETVLEIGQIVEHCLSARTHLFEAIVVDQTMLSYSEACERNKEPVLVVLRQLLTERQKLLEIGSGTGQHACYFAPLFPNLIWQPSDFGEYLPGLRARIRQCTLKNLAEPVELDVRHRPWPVTAADVIFSANTLHIMSWAAVESFFQGLETVLQRGGLVIIYGPFNYDGAYTSGSNARFDLWLKDRDPLSGIRDFEVVDALAQNAGLELEADLEMPANNRCLVWRRRSKHDFNPDSL